MLEGRSAYPASLSVDYPDRDLDRLSTFFRIFVAIPILIILGLMSGGGTQQGVDTGARVEYAAGGLLVAPVMLMLIFRQKYPRWWFDWNLALTRFSLRVGVFLALLRDEYPSTDEEQAVHVEVPYPDAKSDLNRWMPLIKWLLAIPHYFVLIFLGIAAFFCVVVAWFAILFTGRYPRSLFDFVVGVMRWGLRVSAYVIILTTDRYPPFSLGE